MHRRRTPAGSTLVRHRGEWLDCRSGVYRSVGEKQIRAEIATATDEFLQRLNADVTDSNLLRKVSARRVGDALMMAESAATIADDVEAPAWLGEPGPHPAAEYVSMKNGLVHVPTAAKGEPALTPWTPRFFSKNRLPFDWDGNAPPPVEWLRFLGQVFPGDPESALAVQQWFGYIVSGRTNLQKIMCFIGPTRSGKGTVQRVLESLVGVGNHAPSTLQSLAQPFGLAELIGKSLSVVSDARLAFEPQALAVLIERLLSISGEDSTRVDRKHMPAWLGRLPARFMIVSNELPRLPDASGAAIGRLLIVRFSESFYGREDPDLFAKKLAPELPGIMRWAIEGLRLLQESGRIAQPKSAEGLIDLARVMSNPMSEFVTECCEVGPGRKATVDGMYQAWCEWCGGTGHRPGNTSTMSKQLIASVKGLEPAKVVRNDDDKGGFHREFKGIGLL